jgi:hypothetical protein
MGLYQHIVPTALCYVFAWREDQARHTWYVELYAGMIYKHAPCLVEDVIVFEYVGYDCSLTSSLATT